MFDMAMGRRRKLAAFLSFFILVQGFVVVGSAQPADAHHAYLRGAVSSYCEAGGITLEVRAHSWSTDPSSRIFHDTVDVLVDGETKATGSFIPSQLASGISGVADGTPYFVAKISFPAEKAGQSVDVRTQPRTTTYAAGGVTVTPTNVKESDPDESGGPARWVWLDGDGNKFYGSTANTSNAWNKAGNEVTPIAYWYNAGGGRSVSNAGSQGQTIDFTLTSDDCTAGLGDYVWFDLDLQGDQDENEPVEDVTVRLYTGDDDFVADTQTDASGYYEFTGLTPGDYYVVFDRSTADPGFTGFTVADNTADASDSDADPATGRSHTVSLEAGEFDGTIDAGLIAPGQCPLRVDEGDILIDDLHLTPKFRDGNDRSLLSSGDLRFGHQWVPGTVPVPAGVYDVTLVGYDNHFYFGGGNQPTERYYLAGYQSAAPFAQGTQMGAWDLAVGPTDDVPNGADYSPAVTVTGVVVPETLNAFSTFHYSVLNDGVTDTGSVIPTCVRFSPVDQASLGDRVWEDFDRDGIQDDGEPGIEGATVNLWTDGAIVDTTATDTDGLYEFTGLTPGLKYVVEFVKPTGFQDVTAADQGADDSVDSDAVKSGGKLLSHTVVLEPGEHDPTIDAGFFAKVSPVLECWHLVDGEFVAQWGYNNRGTGPVVAAALNQNKVNVDGVVGLPPADDFVFLPGRHVAVFTTNWPNHPGNVVWTLDYSTATLGNDSRQWCETPASLGDHTWFDLDADGVQDEGEPPLDGVTVTLYDATDTDTELGSTTTDANGWYEFTELDPSKEYIVNFAKAGWTPTTPDVGDDALDSDAGVGGDSHTIDLLPGEHDPTIDAGFIPPDADFALGECVVDPVTFASTTSVTGTGTPGTIFTVGDEDYLVGPGGSVSADFAPGTYQWSATFDGFEIASGSFTVEDCAPEPTLEVTAAAICVNDIPYLEYTISPSNLANGERTATFTWTPSNGATGATGADPLEFVQTVDFTYTGDPVTGTLLWPGAVVVDGEATDWPGWSFDGTTWIEEGPQASDSWVRYQPNILVSVNPEAMIPTEQTAYPPATPRCVANPPIGSLGDLVWVDTDGKGSQGDAADEPGIPGVLVTLYEQVDGELVYVDQQTTDGDGYYLFTGLDGGDYVVVFDETSIVLPPGFEGYDLVGFTDADQGDDDALDSDADATGKTGVIELDDGDIKLTVDAGVVIVQVETQVIEDDDTLPVTGLETGTMAVGGILVLGLGAILVTATRRRTEGDAA